MEYTKLDNNLIKRTTSVEEIIKVEDIEQNLKMLELEKSGLLSRIAELESAIVKIKAELEEIKRLN